MFHILAEKVHLAANGYRRQVHQHDGAGLQEFEAKHGIKFVKITKIMLDGDGTILRRVERCVEYPI
jgi:hypothetical protein